MVSNPVTLSSLIIKMTPPKSYPHNLDKVATISYDIGGYLLVKTTPLMQATLLGFTLLLRITRSPL